MNTNFNLSQKLDAVHCSVVGKACSRWLQWGSPTRRYRPNLSSSLSLKHRAEGSGFPQRPLGVISLFDGLVIGSSETVRPAGTQTKSFLLPPDCADSLTMPTCSFNIYLQVAFKGCR